MNFFPSSITSAVLYKIGSISVVLWSFQLCLCYLNLLLLFLSPGFHDKSAYLAPLCVPYTVPTLLQFKGPSPTSPIYPFLSFYVLTLSTLSCFFLVVSSHILSFSHSFCFISEMLTSSAPLNSRLFSYTNSLSDMIFITADSPSLSL